MMYFTTMSSKITFFLFAIYIILINGMNCTEGHSKPQQKPASFCEPRITLPFQGHLSEFPYNATAYAVGFIEALASGKLKNYVPNHPNGVLNQKKDPIIILDSKNFDENVYNNSSLAWFVLFNSKICDSVNLINCVMDSKTWKKLTDSVYNWQKIFVLGEVNCDEPSNRKLCSRYSAWEYQRILYFEPFIDGVPTWEHFDDTSHPVYPHDPYLLNPNSKKNLTILRRHIILHLDKNTPQHKKPAHWPNFTPVTTDEMFKSILVSNNIVYDPEIWLLNLFTCLLTRKGHLSASDFSRNTDILPNHIDSTWRYNNSRLLILIIESNNSFVGRELMLDLHDAPVTVRWTFRTDLFNETKNEELPQVFVITSDNTRERIPLWITSRSGIYLILRSYLRNKGFLLLGNHIECGKYLSLEDLEELAIKAKTHPITVDQMEIIHCMQEKMIQAMADAFRS